MRANRLSFQPLEAKDFPLLYSWLHQDHISNIWGEKPSFEKVVEKYTEKIKVGWLFPYLIIWEQRAIGYLQTYQANKAGDNWWKNEGNGTWGMDQFIGDIDLLGQGIGTTLVRNFSNQLLSREDVSSVIVDPTPTNIQAIRCYCKAGFQKEGLIQTPDGEALLLRKIVIS